jgi:hypothetical protein
MGTRWSDIAGWIAGPEGAEVLFAEVLPAQRHALDTGSHAEPVVRGSLAISLAKRLRAMTELATQLERELTRLRAEQQNPQ